MRQNLIDKKNMFCYKTPCESLGILFLLAGSFDPGGLGCNVFAPWSSTDYSKAKDISCDVQNTTAGRRMDYGYRKKSSYE